MLTLFGSRQTKRGEISRRNFLRIGAFGGGLTLAHLLRLRAESGVAAPRPHKSAVMIFLRGGPSHIDMYDMKPDAPKEIRGEFKPVPTKLPGYNICELLPKQAALMDKMS